MAYGEFFIEEIKEDKRVVLILSIKHIAVRTFFCGPEVVYAKNE